MLINPATGGPYTIAEVSPAANGSLVRYREFKGNMHRGYEAEAIKALPVAKPSSLKTEPEITNMR